MILNFLNKHIIKLQWHITELPQGIKDLRRMVYSLHYNYKTFGDIFMSRKKAKTNDKCISYDRIKNLHHSKSFKAKSNLNLNLNVIYS